MATTRSLAHAGQSSSDATFNAFLHTNSEYRVSLSIINIFSRI